MPPCLLLLLGRTKSTPSAEGEVKRSQPGVHACTYGIQTHLLYMRYLANLHGCGLAYSTTIQLAGLLFNLLRYSGNRVPTLQSQRGSIIPWCCATRAVAGNLQLTCGTPRLSLPRPLASPVLSKLPGTGTDSSPTPTPAQGHIGRHTANNLVTINR